MTATEEQGKPLLRVVKGQPDAAELAALVTVVAARQSAASSAMTDKTTGPVSTWNDRASLMRRMTVPGPDAWRFSTSTR